MQMKIVERQSDENRDLVALLHKADRYDQTQAYILRLEDVPGTS